MNSAFLSAFSTLETIGQMDDIFSGFSHLARQGNKTKWQGDIFKIKKEMRLKFLLFNAVGFPPDIKEGG